MPELQAPSGHAGVSPASTDPAKVKLESRAADLKRQLLRQRQLSVETDGRRSRSSSAAPGNSTEGSEAGVTNGNIAVNLKGGNLAVPCATADGIHQTRRNLSENDIDELIAGLMPPELVCSSPGEMSNAQAAAGKNETKGSKPQTEGEKPTDIRPAVTAEISTALPVVTKSDSFSRSLLPEPSAVETKSDTKPRLPLGNGQQYLSSGLSTPRNVQSRNPSRRPSASATRSDTPAEPTREAGRSNKEQEAKTIEQKTKTNEPKTESRPARMPEPAPMDIDYRPERETTTTMSCSNDLFGATDHGNAYQEDRDLQDWLVFTNYYDVPYRMQFLTRRRRLAALEAERQRLLEEEKEEAVAVRQQFNSLGMPLLGYIPASLSGVRTPATSISSPAPSAAPGFAPTITQSPLLAQASFSTTPASMADGISADRSYFALKNVTSTKREREPSLQGDDGVPERPGKLVRVESTTAKDVKHAKDGSGAGAGADTARVESLLPLPKFRIEKPAADGSNNNTSRQEQDATAVPRKRSESPPLDGLSRSPISHRPPAKNGKQRRDIEEPWGSSPRYDRDRADEPDRLQKDGYGKYNKEHGGEYRYRSDEGGRSRRRRSLDLGQRGDSRFFVVKSFNESNVRRSMEDGLWTTQLKNGKVLADAFETCRHVLLFFSVNKSRAFQGYARMSSLPSPDLPRPSWMKNIHWETTLPFRLEWYNTSTTGFHYVHHLVNAMNENRSVIIGKDGQEIEEECARDLIKEMDFTCGQDLDDSPPPPPRRFSPLGRRPDSRDGPSPGSRLRRDRTW